MESEVNVINSELNDLNIRNSDSSEINWFEIIGDDLCEYILSFITFEDKIRLETVCKQWKQFIYNKQFVLNINNYGYKENNSLNKLWERNSSVLNLIAFVCVLKK